MKRTRAVLLVFAASATLLLAGCIGPMGQHAGNLGGVTFSQSQAVPDFDDGEYKLDDDAVRVFQTLLNYHGVDPGSYSPPTADGCTGGISTRVDMLFFGAGTREVTIDGCAAEDGSFEAEATSFFSDYRESQGEPAAFPNADIVSLTFSQSQAIEGFDTGEYTQDHPQQVARFIELLDTERIVWSEGVDPALAGEPCPGAIMTEITAAYSGTDLVVGPVAIGGCSDLSFADEATALFAGWRESLAG